jgi:hypothetical protein
MQSLIESKVEDASNSALGMVGVCVCECVCSCVSNRMLSSILFFLSLAALLSMSGTGCLSSVLLASPEIAARRTGIRGGTQVSDRV